MLNLSGRNQLSIKGLSEEDNRKLPGTLFPVDTMMPESRISDNDALQLQAKDYQEAIERTETQIETNDHYEVQLVKRVNGLEKAWDLTLEQRELEETRVQQEEDIGSHQRYREWAKENLVRLCAITISFAELINTIVEGGRGAIIRGAQAVGKLASAVT